MPGTLWCCSSAGNSSSSQEHVLAQCHLLICHILTREIGPHKEAMVWLLSLSIVLQDMVLNPGERCNSLLNNSGQPAPLTAPELSWNKPALGKARAQLDCFTSAGQDLAVSRVFQDTLYICFQKP